MMLNERFNETPSIIPTIYIRIMALNEVSSHIKAIIELYSFTYVIKAKYFEIYKKGLYLFFENLYTRITALFMKRGL
ncbi:hypothetical protein H311_01835 [Anncaliia algerae PRA109]|nr:hypothetical protein H311_01835 [Anncaliia algerae PRA109]